MRKVREYKFWNRDKESRGDKKIELWKYVMANTMSNLDLEQVEDLLGWKIEGTPEQVNDYVGTINRLIDKRGEEYVKETRFFLEMEWEYVKDCFLPEKS